MYEWEKEIYKAITNYWQQPSGCVYTITSYYKLIPSEVTLSVILQQM